MTVMYIPHLDGIRALALAGVLLFHFDVAPFTGGYIGVDVFLTLSGFLITRNILLSVHTKSSFSLRTFYIRRFFRLYPASLVCTFFTVLLSIATFPPPLALSVFESALASLSSVANIYFWHKADYFDTAARFKPLLHHWSLSLEEQYYLIWPPLLVRILHFFPRTPRFALGVTLSALCAASFSGAVILSRYFPSFSFYMLPFRLFQFAAGALYAVARHRFTLSSTPLLCHLSKSLPSSEPRLLSTKRLVIETCTVIAAVVIGVSYAVIPARASPLHVTIVILATLTLIATPQTWFATVVLAHPIMSFVGRISYSAYLLHWPLYVFMRYVVPAIHLEQPSALTYMLLTLVFAMVLHRNIEQPFRKPRGMHGAAVIILFAATSMICALGIRQRGFNSRAPKYFDTGFPKWRKQDQNVDFLIQDIKKKLTNRTIGMVARVGDVKHGRRSPYVFFGDSFTGHLETGLNAFGQRQRTWFQIHSAPGCTFLPLDSYTKTHRCYSSVKQMWKEIAELPRNSTIVLGNMWCYRRFEIFKATIPRFRDLVNEMAAHKLVVLGETPGLSEQSLSYFDCAALWQLPIGKVLAPFSRWITNGRFGSKRDGTACAPIREGFAPKQCIAIRARKVRMFMKSVKGVGFIDVFKMMCERNGKSWKEGDVCALPVWFQDCMLYNVGYQMDGFHLSPAGSYYIGINILERALSGTNISQI